MYTSWADIDENNLRGANKILWSSAGDMNMNIYEIRIKRRGTQDPEILSSSHVSDHAAVRRAHALADNGDIIEVWRGTACVFSGEPSLH